MRKKIRQGCSLLLTFALAVLPFAYGVQGATEIDTQRTCSVSFQTDTGYEELSDLAIPVKFYQVAKVDSRGEYHPLEGFESLRLEETDSETTAQEWQEKAALAQSLIEENGTAPAQTVTAAEGARGLDTGMYLVKAERVEGKEYSYSFSPYLLSLPGNAYSDTNPDDTWIYDVETGLKPEEAARYGSIRIEKTLNTYNETFGGASFIFSVEAVKDGENVYSDVVSLVFDGPGSKSLIIDGLLAGAQVTVTEIYSGASYDVVGENVQIVTVNTEDTPTAVFENDYNGESNGGSGILNHFSVDENGVWSSHKQTDSADPADPNPEGLE